IDFWAASRFGAGAPSGEPQADRCAAMRSGRSLTLSLKALLTHKLRTALAVSGVGIGIAAVLTTSALAGGAEHALMRNLTTMGTNLLIVKPTPVKRVVSRKDVQGLATTLTMDDFEAMAGYPLVKEAAPGLDGTMQVK